MHAFMFFSISHLQRFGLLLALCMSLLSSGSAQQTTISQWPTSSETMAFLKQHLPLAAAMMNRVLEEEGRKAYRQVLNVAKDDLALYLEIEAFDGEQAAAEFLKELKLSYLMDDLRLQHARAADEVAKAAIYARLLETAKQQHALTKLSLERERVFLVETLEGLDEELEELVAMTDTDLKDMVDDLLAGKFDDVLVVDKPEDVTPIPVPAGWQASLKPALKLAGDRKKPVLVVFSAAWCPPCVDMAKEIYPHERVVEAMKNFVPVYVNGDEHEGLCKTYRVRHYPYFAVLNSEGEKLDWMEGSMSVDDFCVWLKKDR